MPEKPWIGWPLKGKLQIGDAGAVLAGNGAERFGALAVRRRELAGMLEEFGGIGRCRNHGVGRQDRLAGELGRKLLLVGRSGGRDQDEKRYGSKKDGLHNIPVERMRMLSA